MALSSLQSFFYSLNLLKSPPPPPPVKLPPPNLSVEPQISRPLALSNSSLSPCSNDVASVVCPSLAYANTMFFRSAYNVQVIVDDTEAEERLLGRFRREVMKAGIIQECKRRRFFENKQDEKKRKSREAAKRNRRRRPQARFGTGDRQEAVAKPKKEDDDNWELPVGNIP